MDLKSYAMGEGSASERKAAEAQLLQSAEAREELRALEFTLQALKSIPDEEIPRRIAFVSDPVFAPTWWERFWQSGPQLGFASAAMLTMAILGHGALVRPDLAPALGPVVAQTNVSPADVDRAVAVAVNRALAAAETRQKVMLDTALAAAEQRHRVETQMMAVTFDENLSLLRKQLNRMYVTSANLSAGGAQ